MKNTLLNTLLISTIVIVSVLEGYTQPSNTSQTIEPVDSIVILNKQYQKYGVPFLYQNKICYSEIPKKIYYSEFLFDNFTNHSVEVVFTELSNPQVHSNGILFVEHDKIYLVDIMQDYLWEIRYQQATKKKIKGLKKNEYILSCGSNHTLGTKYKNTFPVMIVNEEPPEISVGLIDVDGKIKKRIILPESKRYQKGFNLLPGSTILVYQNKLIVSSWYNHHLTVIDEKDKISNINSKRDSTYFQSNISYSNAHYSVCSLPDSNFNIGKEMSLSAFLLENGFVGKLLDRKDTLNHANLFYVELYDLNTNQYITYKNLPPNCSNFLAEKGNDLYFSSNMIKGKMIIYKFKKSDFLE